MTYSDDEVQDLVNAEWQRGYEDGQEAARPAPPTEAQESARARVAAFLDALVAFYEDDDQEGEVASVGDHVLTVTDLRTLLD